MRHCDSETLALAALGERIPPEEAAHLETCEQCLTDVAELIEVVTLAREAPQVLTAPPEAVWEGIRGELRMGRDTVTDLSAGSEIPVEADISPDDAGIVRMEAARAKPRRTWPRTAAVAAVAASVGALIGGTIVWGALEQRDEAGTTERVVAQAVLDPLSPTVPLPGKAQVLQTADGLVVRVDARSLPPSPGFHEVWLLDAEATKLVSLGALPSGSVGTFTVPPGVELADFPVVDISLEPYDGNPEHSTDSLMRGTLAT